MRIKYDNLISCIDIPDDIVDDICLDVNTKGISVKDAVDKIDIDKFTKITYSESDIDFTKNIKKAIANAIEDRLDLYVTTDDKKENNSPCDDGEDECCIHINNGEYSLKYAMETTDFKYVCSKLYKYKEFIIKTNNNCVITVSHRLYSKYDKASVFKISLENKNYNEFYFIIINTYTKIVTILLVTTNDDGNKDIDYDELNITDKLSKIEMYPIELITTLFTLMEIKI